jgi:hypothetical protein
VRRAALAVGGVWVAACVEAPAPSGDVIDVSRAASSVSVRRARGGVEQLRIDVDAGPGVVSLTAATAELALAIDAAATAPGVPITATLRAGGAVLDVRNDLVVQGDVALRLGAWRERNQVVAMLGAIAPALVEVAPYRTAIEARLAEAAPLFVAVGLFQGWPDGVEPAWPVLDDPRDVDPPGHLDGDVIGLGMTCSASIRCPNSAPYCVTIDHATSRGVCTRACASDAACRVDGGIGRCAQPVVDIPDVADPVLTCEVACAAGSCPGLLACADATTCSATQD